MQITDTQKRIYNQYLSTYKQSQNKPYTLRIDFDGFEKEKPEAYACILKLANFFHNHKYVNMKLFFEAPYKIYEDREYFDICYYNSQAAIKCYTLYLTQLEEQSPDGMAQLAFINDSLVFIKKYCIEHEIPLNKYFTINDGLTPAWVVNYIANNTSIYCLIGFEYFNIAIQDMMYSFPPDQIELYFGTTTKNYLKYKVKLENSKKAKTFVIVGIKTIDKSINKHLNLI